MARVDAVVLEVQLREAAQRVLRITPPDPLGLTTVRAENVYCAIQLGAACGRRGKRDSLILAVNGAFVEYTLHHVAISVADDDGEVIDTRVDRGQVA